ncbi:Jag domain-containing protein [Campylobacter blaseri]|uniref:RNA-binding protein KhpB N-terminal domain-containing protein n=1 Tax=Campylobacter blaseri TaxID=2042961 RepID=A0A2P8QZR5_9BACT|nr:Jag N-terminal domain-containing protein [Campylobacter blaseri]PSM51728.1 hypothetical protein CQ405_06250 [Campylobacter blaseri]PSM53519.1 hypothetical protein CRN67_06255 [Campylobacter blaseri]QKF86327.1 Jag domain-containing protein [Campylobacter blaseri]
MRIEAKNLQEAITKAAEKLGCSVVDLKIDVVQHPSNGIFGFLKKNAIINASFGKDEQKISKTKDVKEKNIKKDSSKKVEKKQQDLTKQEELDTIKKPSRLNRTNNKKSKRKEPVNIELVLSSIDKEIKDLFSKSIFEIEVVEISKFDDRTIYVKLDGEDAALLIGKEGARYKAISTLLYNYLSLKYGLYVRLEISQFYENQEKMIANYLKDIFEKIDNNGKAQTRPLDGILIKIALEQLREAYPEKYIGVRSSKNGKFIVINDKIKKQ